MEVKRHRNANDPTDVFYEDGTVDYSRVQGNNPLGGGEYPKALYRAGGLEKIHGHMVDTAVADSEEQEEAMSQDGWRTTPAKAVKLGERLIAEPESDDKPRRGRPPKTDIGDQI